MGQDKDGWPPAGRLTNGNLPPCAGTAEYDILSPFSIGAVAQLDRASDYESEGYGFDSRQPRQSEAQIAGWSSLVARQAHNLKVVGSNPAPATKFRGDLAHDGTADRSAAW